MSEDLTPLPSGSPDPRYAAMTAAERSAAMRGMFSRFHEVMEDTAKLLFAMRAANDDMAEAQELWGDMLYELLEVGCGRVAIEALRRFGKHRQVYSRVRRLNLADQRQLAEGGKVPVVTFVDDKPTHRMVDPIMLSKKDPQALSLVFAPDHIRTEAEQAAILDREVRSKRVVPEKVGDVTIDRQAKTITVPRRMTLTASQLRQYLKVLGERP